MAFATVKFAALGECMIELRHVDAQTLAMGFAGDTFNMALYLARYQHRVGAEVNYITALGDDPYSDMLLENLQQEAIGNHLIAKIPGHLPGLYFIRTDKQGERSFYYYRSQSAARQLFYSQQINTIIDNILQCDYLYLSGISLAIFDEYSQKQLLTLLKTAKTAGVKICFDINYRPKLWPNIAIAQAMTQSIYKYTDIALPTFSDEQLLFGDETPESCYTRLRHWGINEIVLKLGERGCLIHSGEGYEYVQAEKNIKPVDTTAAGDSFNAAYLAARIKGLTIREAAECGNKLAAVVVSYPGAIIPKSAMPKLY